MTHVYRDHAGAIPHMVKFQTSYGGGRGCSIFTILVVAVTLHKWAGNKAKRTISRLELRRNFCTHLTFPMFTPLCSPSSFVSFFFIYLWPHMS